MVTNAVSGAVGATLPEFSLGIAIGLALVIRATAAAGVMLLVKARRE